MVFISFPFVDLEPLVFDMDASRFAVVGELLDVEGPV